MSNLGWLGLTLVTAFGVVILGLVSLGVLNLNYFIVWWFILGVVLTAGVSK